MRSSTAFHPHVARCWLVEQVLPLCAGAACLFVLGCSEPAYGSQPDATSTQSGVSEDSGKARELDAGDPLARPRDTSLPMVTDADAPRPEPEPRPDAGMVEPADAGALPTPSTAAQMMVGRYAMRRRYFGRSPERQLGTFVEEAIALVDVEPRPDGKLQLRYEQCTVATHVTSAVLPSMVSRPLHPELVPERVLELRVDGESFETVGDPHIIGYDPMAAAGCTAGAKLMLPDRPWIAGGACTCVGSSTPPTDKEDCRVIDSDRDGNPGFTAQLVGGGMPTKQQFLRTKEISQYVRGLIDTTPRKKHTARFQVARDQADFDCPRSGCPGGWAAVGCTEQYNSVFFELRPERNAAGEPFSCADLIRAVEARTLLDNGEPVFPDGC